METNTFNVIFDKLEEKANQSIKQNEGDYIVDGLLYCGKCNTKKQTRIEILGKIRTPMCLCKCEAERRDKEEAEHKRRQRMMEIEKMRKIGFPESEMQSWTFANDDKLNAKTSAIAKNYADNFETMKERKKGLLLYGSVGTGKSYHAACIVNELIDKGYPAMMTNFSRLVNTINGMFEGKQQYIDGLNKFDLLVIDDLSAERDTEFMNEIVFTIIDSRYRAGLPLIITTNLTADEIKHPADVRKQRTYSRLLEMTIPVEVKGSDRRRNKLKNDYADLSDILGLNVTE